MAALWLESPLLASMQALSVGLLELFWTVEFLLRLLTGVRLIGLTDYMFKTDNPLFVRGLSLFHLVLPFLLLWLVYRLGYEARAWMAQTLLAWAILLLCFFFTDPAENINWAFGLGNEPQKRINPALYLVLLMAGFPLLVYLPTHLLLETFLGK